MAQFIKCKKFRPNRHHWDDHGVDIFVNFELVTTVEERTVGVITKENYNQPINDRPREKYVLLSLCVSEGSEAATESICGTLEDLVKEYPWIFVRPS